MKRILALVILAVFFSANAFAANLTATFGDQNAAKKYRMQAADDGTITFANDTPIVYPYENIVNAPSSKYTLSNSDNGSSIVDWGITAVGTAAPGSITSSGTLYVLPLCATATFGYNYHIATAVKETITVTPTSNADSLAWSISGTGESAGLGIKNSGTGQAGDGADFTCTTTGVWSVSDVTGTWANSTLAR